MFLSNFNRLQKASLQCRRFLRARECAMLKLPKRGGNDLPCTHPTGPLRVTISTIPNLPLSLIKDGGHNNTNTNKVSPPKIRLAIKKQEQMRSPALIHLFKFFLYNVLYSFINLTILGFLHSVEIAFFLFSLFYSFPFYVCICASVFLLTCNLILFNADVNCLPGSASPHGYSRQPVL